MPDSDEHQIATKWSRNGPIAATLSTHSSATLSLDPAGIEAVICSQRDLVLRVGSTDFSPSTFVCVVKELFRVGLLSPSRAQCGSIRPVVA